MSTTDINYFVILGIIMIGLGGPMAWILWKDRKRNKHSDR